MARIWSIPIPILGIGAGNVIGANSTTVGAVSLWSNTNGTGLADSTILSSDGGQLAASRRITSGLVTLTDGPTPALDASLGNTFYLNSAQNPTLAVPTNATNGQVIVIIFRAITSARTLTLNSGAGGFKHPIEIPALTATTGNAFDLITCKYSTINSKWNVMAYTKDYS